MCAAGSYQLRFLFISVCVCATYSHLYIVDGCTCIQANSIRV